MDSTADLSTFVYEDYGTMFKALKINQPLREILRRVVQTRDPELMLAVLKQLRGRVGLENIVHYRDNLREVFLEVLSDDDLLRFRDPILLYYSPREDRFLLSEVYLRAINAGDMPLVVRLSPFFPKSIVGFWHALSTGQIDIATYLRNHLLESEIDPIANDEWRSTTYEFVIFNRDLKTAQLMSEVVAPTEEEVKLAEKNGRDEIAKLLRSQIV